MEMFRNGWSRLLHSAGNYCVAGHLFCFSSSAENIIEWGEIVVVK